jgi:cell division protein FtsL
MNTTIPTNWIILLGILAVVLLAVAIGYISQRQRQSKRLRQRFGAEYDRAVTEFGRNKAEAELKAREKRVEKLTIIPLAPADAARFTQAWTALQGRFIDNPKGVVVEADHLVRELMLKRGYPMGDFEMRAADISVDHPAVVENYRAAQAIAVRDERGEADTEELRRAVVHYRTLFDELLGERPAKRVEPPAGQIPVHS